MNLERRDDSTTPLVSSVPFPTSRFLSAEECQMLVKRVTDLTQGGGETTAYVNSTWTGNLRWGRNRITSSGDVRDNQLQIDRSVRGATGSSTTNALDDRHLLAAIRRAERLEEGSPHVPIPHWVNPPFLEPYPSPAIWSDVTYNQTAEARAALMQTLIEPVRAAGMLSAGYMQVSATGRSSMLGNVVWYFPYTQAQYSVTVRDPQGTASGWAGVSGTDWSKIDTKALSAVALEKCLRSRNPVRLEPGRYETILEPQAVGDLVKSMFGIISLNRGFAEMGDPRHPSPDGGNFPGSGNSPFHARAGFSKIGSLVIDPRLGVRTDNMDPDLGFPPFQGWQVYHPATWIKQGVLRELAYTRAYAVQVLGQHTGGQPQFGDFWNGAFHMTVTGPTAAVDDMISTVKRGVLVTRLSNVSTPLDRTSLLTTGYTRDGTWLIENGKVTHPIMNFRFTESPLFILNNVEQIGVPQPIFSPAYPIVVPALKVRDFSFTGLSDSV